MKRGFELIMTLPHSERARNNAVLLHVHFVQPRAAGPMKSLFEKHGSTLYESPALCFLGLDTTEDPGRSVIDNTRWDGFSRSQAMLSGEPLFSGTRAVHEAPSTVVIYPFVISISCDWHIINMDRLGAQERCAFIKDMVF